MKIAIDIGGVLIGKGKSHNQLFDVPHSYEALEYLAINNYLYIVSYCKERMAQYNYEKLIDLDLFWAQYYVSQKPFKSSIINYLDCDVMIDDNENILNTIKQNNPKVITILFQQYNKQKKNKHKLHYLANNWIEIIEFLEINSRINHSPQRDPKDTGYFIDNSGE